MSRSVFFMKVRARERKTRFRSLLRAEDLILFFADAVVAKRPPWIANLLNNTRFLSLCPVSITYTMPFLASRFGYNSEAKRAI